jgi:hypothetical protein
MSVSDQSGISPPVVVIEGLLLMQMDIVVFDQRALVPPGHDLRGEMDQVIPS